MSGLPSPAALTAAPSRAEAPSPALKRNQSSSGLLVAISKAFHTPKDVGKGTCLALSGAMVLVSTINARLPFQPEFSRQAQRGQRSEASNCVRTREHQVGARSPVERRDERLDQIRAAPPQSGIYNDDVG